MRTNIVHRHGIVGSPRESPVWPFSSPSLGPTWARGREATSHFSECIGTSGAGKSERFLWKPMDVYSDRRTPVRGAYCGGHFALLV